VSEVLVVGAGISGSVIARHLAEQGKKVTVWERRPHIAGNLYDHVHECGIRVQDYGPHIFHTRKPELFDYLARFGKWEPFKLECMVYMNGQFTPSPFNYQTIDDYFPPEKAAEIKTHLETAYPGREKATIVEMLKCSDPVVKEYANYLFDNDYSLYTAKQWGISPEEIDISVLSRVPVLLSYQTGYFDDPVQMMPTDGFTAVIRRILDHKNIEISLNTDGMGRLVADTDGRTVAVDGKIVHTPVIYSGALDELLDYRFGRLPYRSLRFEWETAAGDNVQPAPVVAYPQAPDYTRVTEYNKLPVQPPQGVTVYAREYSVLSDEQQQEPYYPIPTDQNEQLYRRYRDAVCHIPNLYLCGRLADYKYYNIDQALEKALEMCSVF
jgi:UDP-galactopyranose mutase